MLTRPLGRPKNRWKDYIINDMKKLKIKNWTSCIQDRSKWKLYAEKAKRSHVWVGTPTQTWLRPVTTCVCKPEAANTVRAPDDERRTARNMFNERWNNKFCYKVAFCWLFLLNYSINSNSCASRWSYCRNISRCTVPWRQKIQHLDKAVGIPVHAAIFLVWVFHDISIIADSFVYRASWVLVTCFVIVTTML